MIRIFKSLRGSIILKPIASHFSTVKQNTYIPIRPLKDERNLLFTIGNPSNISIPGKVLIFTPFLAVTLDGFINEWTNWRIAGSLFFLWAGFRIIRFVNFSKSHQVYALKVNKDLSKFYITITNNYFAWKYEEALLDSEKKTFEQKFMQNLKNKTLEISEDIYTQLNKSSESELKNHIAFLKSMRHGVILELNRKDIDKFQFVSQSDVRKVLRQDLLTYLLGKKKDKEVLEEYSALKDKKNYVLITTKPFKKWNDQPMRFFFNFQLNADKKYEEYIKALAQGKKIVEP